MDDGQGSRELESDQTDGSGGRSAGEHAGSPDRSSHRPKFIACAAAPVAFRLDEQLAKDRMSCLGVLAASITREISTPLTYVTLQVETLAAELCRAAGHDVPRGWRPLGKNGLAERALLGVAGTQRMRDVVRHISAFSGFNDEARLTEVDVATALHAAVEMGTSEHVLRVQVVTHCDDVPDVRANPRQLAQALLSLLITAAHSCEQGDPQERELGVRIRQQAAEVVVEVSDSRSGPNTKRSDTILDPFRSVSGEGNGSELGLSLCATVIASFAGRVLVGRGGGRFVVRLPCATG